MKKNKILKFLSVSALLLPTVAFAALTSLRTFLTDFKGLINLIIEAVFALAVVFFFWGITQFILNDAGNDKTRDEGKRKILWGIIALFVMFSIWGILNFIGDATGLLP